MCFQKFIQWDILFITTLYRVVFKFLDFEFSKEVQDLLSEEQGGEIRQKFKEFIKKFIKGFEFSIANQNIVLLPEYVNEYIFNILLHNFNIKKLITSEDIENSINDIVNELSLNTLNIVNIEKKIEKNGIVKILMFCTYGDDVNKFLSKICISSIPIQGLRFSYTWFETTVHTLFKKVDENKLTIEIEFVKANSIDFEVVIQSISNCLKKCVHTLTKLLLVIEYLIGYVKLIK